MKYSYEITIFDKMYVINIWSALVRKREFLQGRIKIKYANGE